MLNFYTCLEVSENASYDEIRRAYYRKMLKVHPDRSSAEPTSSCHYVNAAWEVLRDQTKRSEYDTKLKVNRAAQESHAFYEPVNLYDFTCVSENNEWILECRCGGQYKVTSMDIANGFRYFCCSNCSLKINLVEL